MKHITILLAAVLCLATVSLARKGFGPGEQEWDYVQVRPNAHMFWWLYFTTANVNSFYEKPLIIWLQGGPGGSSTSFGNFEEIGPLDVNLKPRNYTWVKDYNLLFIDNPVGTGFSFANDSSGFATTNAQIAADLVECMKGFLKKLPKFANVPTYITTESYGGKMGAEFALLWYKEQKAGKINSNLRGVALGDAWISPIDSVKTWAPFLLATGMVDTQGYREIDEYAKKTEDLVNAGDWDDATSLWGQTEDVIFQMTNNIDFYNILTRVPPRRRMFSPIWPSPSKTDEHVKNYAANQQYSLDSIINGPVREALGLSHRHCSQCGTVFAKLTVDFMKPVINIVELLLEETDLKVIVLTGHMDLIVDTPGTLLWVEKLRWKGADNWERAARNAVIANNVIEGYVKAYGNLAMYWINRAGHMVPRDNPAGMAKILEDLVR